MDIILNLWHFVQYYTDRLHLIASFSILQKQRWLIKTTWHHPVWQRADCLLRNMIHAASNNGIGLQHNITHDCAPTDCSMHKLDHGRSHPGLIAQFDSQFSTSSLIHTSLACWAQWGDQWTDIPMFYLKHTQKCLAPTPLSRLIRNCGTKSDPLPHTCVWAHFSNGC